MKGVNRIIREPLLHFLLLAGGLFLLYNMINGTTVEKPNRIVVSPGQVELLAENFTRTWQRQPTEEELAALFKNYLRDEVFYREAIALGLDKDDNLIRRRMRQKLEFILEDVTSLMDPTDDELTVYMHQHKDLYRLPPQVSFRQIYLSPDKRQDIEADADELLARLIAGENFHELGDEIMLDDEYTLASQPDIERRFGKGFARQLVSIPVEAWTGPVISGFGGHLVLISEKVEGRMPKLAEVRKEVQRDWLLDQRNELKEATYNNLLEEYEIVIQAATAQDYGSGSAVAATLTEAERKASGQ